VLPINPNTESIMIPNIEYRQPVNNNHIFNRDSTNREPVIHGNRVVENTTLFDDRELEIDNVNIDQGGGLPRIPTGVSVRPGSNTGSSALWHKLPNYNQTPPKYSKANCSAAMNQSMNRSFHRPRQPADNKNKNIFDAPVPIREAPSHMEKNSNLDSGPDSDAIMDRQKANFIYKKKMQKNSAATLVNNKGPGIQETQIMKQYRVSKMSNNDLG
jgi:hypothetical protein